MVGEDQTSKNKGGECDQILIINAKPCNFVKPSKKLTDEFKKQFDRYHDKRYHLKRGKKNGKYMWKWVMWKRARQIEYFKRRRRNKK